MSKQTSDESEKFKIQALNFELVKSCGEQPTKFKSVKDTCAMIF